MAFSKEQLRSIYSKRAKHYDLTANLYYLLGFREFALRKAAIEALNLNAGDTVVELGCGTGLNFSILQKRICTTGKIIGVDLTPQMLDQARKRTQRHGWKNVELVQSDIAQYKIPRDVTAVLSTFAITLVPEYNEVIKSCASVLRKEGRLVVADFKEPSNWPRFLLQTWLAVTRPFGVTLDLAQRHPWESIEHYFPIVHYREFYFGLTYCAMGTFERPEAG